MIVLLASLAIVARAALLFRVAASANSPLCESEVASCTATLRGASIVSDAEQLVLSFDNPPLARRFSRVDVELMPRNQSATELTATMWVKVTDPLSFRLPARFVSNQRHDGNSTTVFFSVLPSPNVGSPFGFLANLRTTLQHVDDMAPSDFNFIANRGPPVMLFPQRWHHVAMVLNATHAALFLDLVEVRSRLRVHGPVVFSGDVFTIGGTRNSSSAPWEDAGITGLMDDVRMYTHALSVNELKAVFFGGAPTDPLPIDARLPTVYDVPQFVLRDINESAVNVQAMNVMVAFTPNRTVMDEFITGRGIDNLTMFAPQSKIGTGEGFLLVTANRPGLNSLQGFGAQFTVGLQRAPIVASLGVSATAHLHCSNTTRPLSAAASSNSTWMWAPFDAEGCSGGAAGIMRFAVQFLAQPSTITVVDIVLFQWLAPPFSPPVFKKPVLTRKPLTTTPLSATTAPPLTTITPTTSTTANAVGHLSPPDVDLGAVIGGVVGGIAILALIVGGVVLWRKRSAHDAAAEPRGNNQYGQLPQVAAYGDTADVRSGYGASGLSSLS